MKLYSARWIVFFLGGLALLGIGAGAWLGSLPSAPSWIVIAMAAPSLVLLPLAVAEWRTPVLELEPTRLLLRAGRLRAPIVVERPAGVALDVQKEGLLLTLASTGGAPWVDGRLRRLARDGGKCLVLPTASLSGPDRARLETALREWVKG